MCAYINYSTQVNGCIQDLSFLHKCCTLAIYISIEILSQDTIIILLLLLYEASMIHNGCVAAIENLQTKWLPTLRLKFL